MSTEGLVITDFINTKIVIIVLPAIELLFLLQPDPLVPGARRNSSFIMSMMLGVLINFDKLICPFFQNFVLSSPSHPLNEIWLYFECYLLEMGF